MEILIPDFFVMAGKASAIQYIRVNRRKKMTQQEVEKMIPLLRHIMGTLKTAWENLIKVHAAKEILLKVANPTLAQKVEVELLDEISKQITQRIGEYDKEVEALGGAVLEYNTQTAAFQIDGRLLCTWNARDGIKTALPSQVFALDK